MKAIILGSIITIAVITATAIAVSHHKSNNPKEITMQPTGNFLLSSPIFAEDGTIPKKYTCKGDNISPPLEIRDVPEDAVSLALILHDPDAPNGDFLHWTIWNIPPDTKSIDEGSVPSGAAQGKTGFGKTGYGGPCPPSGTHHYEFDLYALDKNLNTSAGATRQMLEQAMSGHIIAQTKLVGLVSAE
jgi:Raf kinase inhibitor-like YbhB/YbcL family protein